MPGLLLQFQLWVLCSQGVKQYKEHSERTMKVLPCMICLLKNSFSFHEVIDPISVFIITLPCEKVVLNFNKGRELHISTRAQMLPAIQEVESSFANSYHRPDSGREREIICPHQVNKPCIGYT